jgi:hypothetical protein
LEGWQERLTALLHRKVSMGETVGILTRICTARLLRLPESPDPRTLADLAEDMIGHE